MNARTSSSHAALYTIPMFYHFPKFRQQSHFNLYKLREWCILLFFLDRYAWTCTSTQQLFVRRDDNLKTNNIVIRGHNVGINFAINVLFTPIAIAFITLGNVPLYLQIIWMPPLGPHGHVDRGHSFLYKKNPITKCSRCINFFVLSRNKNHLWNSI